MSPKLILQSKPKVLVKSEDQQEGRPEQEETESRLRLKKPPVVIKNALYGLE